MWDLRKVTAPLLLVSQLETFYETDAIFSPDESVISKHFCFFLTHTVTGTSVKRDSTQSGKVHYYSTSTFELVKEEDLGPVGLCQLTAGGQFHSGRLAPRAQSDCHRN